MICYFLLQLRAMLNLQMITLKPFPHWPKLFIPEYYLPLNTVWTAENLHLDQIGPGFIGLAPLGMQCDASSNGDAAPLLQIALSRKDNFRPVSSAMHPIICCRKTQILSKYSKRGEADSWISILRLEKQENVFTVFFKSPRNHIKRFNWRTWKKKGKKKIWSKHQSLLSINKILRVFFF